MNKLYTNFVVGNYNKNSATNGIRTQPCEIVSVKIVPGAFYGVDALHLDLREQSNGSSKSFGYGLIGENVFNEFMKDLDVDRNHPEGLVGKVVDAHVPKNDTLLIRGISLLK